MKREVAVKTGNFRGVCPKNGRSKTHTCCRVRPKRLEKSRILTGPFGNARHGVNENRPPKKTKEANQNGTGKNQSEAQEL